MKLIKRIVAASFLCVLITGCVAASTPAASVTQASAHDIAQANQDTAFQHWMQDDLFERVKANKEYRRLPLDTPAQAEEFMVWLHALYRQRISPEEFAQRVQYSYPGHDAEVNFILSCLPPPTAR